LLILAGNSPVMLLSSRIRTRKLENTLGIDAGNVPDKLLSARLSKLTRRVEESSQSTPYQSQ